MKFFLKRKALIMVKGEIVEIPANEFETADKDVIEHLKTLKIASQLNDSSGDKNEATAEEKKAAKAKAAAEKKAAKAAADAAKSETAD